MVYITPLIDEHKKLGATIGLFAGWKTAIFFKSAIKEHIAVRKNIGIFDLSHMSRIMVSGKDSLKLLNFLVAKDISKLKDKTMSGPTAFLNDKAGFRDDVMIYRIDEEHYLLVGNAINWKKDLNILLTNKRDLNVKIKDLTLSTAMLAIQGPISLKIMEKVVDDISLEDLKFMTFKKNVKIKGIGNVLILSRSGWTGENGYEIIGKNRRIIEIYHALVKNGVEPCGLATRDSLRIEMGFCLYEHEIDENINPIEARYVVFDLDKKDQFIGKDRLLDIYNKGVQKVRVGIRMKKHTPIPRKGAKIYAGENIIGEITSGTYSPILGRAIAQGYIDSKHALFGLKFNIEVRKKMFKGKIVDFPFINPNI